MLLYYTNGTVFVVYTNPQALHHHKGIRSGDRILSVNGKNVKFYKDRFFSELNEVRPNRDLLIQYETGSPTQQKILVLPNIALPDRNLDKLLMALNNNVGRLRSIQPSTSQTKKQFHTNQPQNQFAGHTSNPIKVRPRRHIEKAKISNTLASPHQRKMAN